MYTVGPSGPATPVSETPGAVQAGTQVLRSAPRSSLRKPVWPAALETGFLLDVALYAASAMVERSHATVVRCMSRTSSAGNGRARCMVARLSHITRSHCFHTWL